MPAGKEWLLYLESNPALWKISQSRLLMQVLERLSEEALPLREIYVLFPKIGMQDLEELLDIFIKSGLVSKKFVVEGNIFRATPKGKKFLELYKKAESEFRIE